MALNSYRGAKNLIIQRDYHPGKGETWHCDSVKRDSCFGKHFLHYQTEYCEKIKAFSLLHHPEKQNPYIHCSHLMKQNSYCHNKLISLLL